VVHHCPAVSDAARSIPGAEIDWVVEESFAAIPSMHPAGRRVLPLALRRWRHGWWRASTREEVRAFRRALRAESYDAVVDTQSLLKSALVAAQARGRSHGMDRASAREALAAAFYDVRHPVPRALHAVERNRRLAAAALGYTAEAAPDYGLGGVDSATAEAPYAVLLTMTSRADKLWPEERWIEAARTLGLPAVLPWGSPAERGRAERIAAALAEARVPPFMSLEQLARLLARARAVLGVDTGLTHLAAALGARTVGIYCGSDPALTGIHGAPNARNVGAPGRPPAPAEVLQALR
jgi:heptosyltransferase I